MNENTEDILKLLQDYGALTTDQLVEKTKLQKAQVRGSLSTLTNRGLVVKKTAFGTVATFELAPAGGPTSNATDSQDTSEQEAFLKILVSREKVFPKNTNIIFTLNNGKTREVWLIQPATFRIEAGTPDPEYKDIVRVRVEVRDDEGRVIEAFEEDIKPGESISIVSGIV